MSKLVDKITTFLKSENIRYLISDDEKKISLAYVYGKEPDLARVVLFMDINEKTNEVEMGFINKISNDLQSEEALEQMLVLNNQLKTGRIGLANNDDEKRTLTYSLHFTINEEQALTKEFYLKKIRTCFGVHSLLIERKIIENDYTQE